MPHKRRMAVTTPHRRSKAAKAARSLARKNFKSAKKDTVTALVAKIMEEKVSNSWNRFPHSYISDIIDGLKDESPWLTRSVLNKGMRNFTYTSVTADNNIEEQRDAGSLTTPHCISNRNLERNTGGRPKGSSDKMKKDLADATMAANNEITIEYIKLKKYAKKTKKTKLPNGILKKLIIDISKKRCLPSDIIISESAIRKRIERGSTFVTQSAGVVSPLSNFESFFVMIIIQMARIRQSLTPRLGLAMVNAVIQGNRMQKEIIEWKARYSNDNLPTLGVGYWRGFMKRNKDQLVSKRGQKYELNRDNWTTYQNFNSMYKHNIGEMEDAGVAVRRVSPVWMDRSGNIVDESKAYGCKVTHDIIHPEYCIVADEVGNNISMKNDGHIGGQKYLCAKGAVPQQKASTKDKHFTLLGLTLLNGEPLMCVVIIQGTLEKSDYWAGIDILAEKIGDESDDDFLEMNSGPGKLFPGGPSCTVCGKVVPCFVRFQPKGGMTSVILKDILRTLDELEVFPRVNGLKPFLLVDGHGSRLEIPFLEYINEPDHEWVVCIGVPYGTDLWQVGDSKEQNGSYNMSLTKNKEKMFQEREKRCMEPTIQPYDIMPLVNAAWKDSFSKVATNKNAISERGWFPYNRALLLNAQIRSTMTNEEKELEAEGSEDVMVPSIALQNIIDVSIETPHYDPAFLLQKDAKDVKLLNMSHGTAAFCLQNLVAHEDLHQARAQIKRNREEGATFREKITMARKVSAGIVFKSGSTRLGQTVLDVVKSNAAEKQRLQQEKKVKAIEAYHNAKEAAD